MPRAARRVAQRSLLGGRWLRGRGGLRDNVGDPVSDVTPGDPRCREPGPLRVPAGTGQHDLRGDVLSRAHRLLRDGARTCATTCVFATAVAIAVVQAGCGTPREIKLPDGGDARADTGSGGHVGSGGTGSGGTGGGGTGGGGTGGGSGGSGAAGADAAAGQGGADASPDVVPDVRPV